MGKKYFERIQNLDRLIRIKGTGPPRQFARRIGISERTLYESLNLMKELGAPISYCAIRQSYYYETDGFFLIEFRKNKNETLP